MSGGDTDERQRPEDALWKVLDAYPQARVTAVDPDGLHIPLPDGFPLGDRQVVTERTGLELVGADHRRAVLQQFLDLGRTGASSLAVETPDGRPARLFMFDCTASLGVLVSVIAEDVDDAAPALAVEEAGPVRPRYGRIWRTMYSDVLRLDDAITEMYGHTLEDFTTREASDFVHPDDQMAARTNWFDVIGSPHGTVRRWRARYHCADGSYLWTEITNTNNLEDPVEPHVLSEMVDISEEMRVVDELWTSQELLRRLTAALPVGVVHFDAAGSMAYANDRMYDLLDIATDGDLFAALSHVHPEDAPHYVEAVASVLSGGPDVDMEIRYQPPGAPLRYLELALRAVHGRDESVAGAVIAATDVTDAFLLRRELEDRATYDALTGCHNRAAIIAEIERAVAATSEDGTGVGVVYVDLDGFKAINDRDGHAAGDAILRVVAERLRGAVRDGDIVGRVGGDEFVVLCPSVASASVAMDVAVRIAGCVAGPVRIEDRAESIALSVGVAWSPNGTGVDADVLVAAADAAMYRSKREGAGRPVLGSVEPGSARV